MESGKVFTSVCGVLRDLCDSFRNLCETPHDGAAVYEVDGDLRGIGLTLTNRDIVSFVDDLTRGKDCAELSVEDVQGILPALSALMQETHYTTPHGWRWNKRTDNPNSDTYSKVYMDMELTEHQVCCMTRVYLYSARGDYGRALLEFRNMVDNNGEPERYISHVEYTLYTELIYVIGNVATPDKEGKDNEERTE